MKRACAEVPENGDWLNFEHNLVSSVLSTVILIRPLTSARRIKSVAALIPPEMRKNLITLTHLAPGTLPARVVQNPAIGIHWKMHTKSEEMVRQEVKTVRRINKRRYCWIGKIRYWKRMMVNLTLAMAKM